MMVQTREYRMRPKMYDVSVVIPTFRRPQLLDKTVSSVAQQTNVLKLAYEIIVVDNCPERSAEAAVSSMIENYEIPIHYVSEPRQNIALARNAGIDHSNAEFIAMIDDDEQAASDWLHHLVTTAKRYETDVVMGPTTPVFEKDVPAWFGGTREPFDRNRNIPTGTKIELGPSANFLMRSATCTSNNNRFDPELGRSGGSDTDFFMRLAKRMGRKLVWCNEAKVQEFIPESRLTVRYLMRRKLRNNQALVWCSVRNSDHPIRTASYLMFVVGCTQIAIWIIPSLISAPFRTAYSVRVRGNFMKGVGKLFWGKMFRLNFY
jgi:glycosyltransferase involved in cell wall biosynthesis